MKNKKGFTFIELLAVIVILAIIMVISIPKILDVINSSRESAQDSSKKLLKEGIKTQVMVDNINNTNNFIKETTTDGECYKFDFDNENTNYQNLDVNNKDSFTSYTNYCEDGFHDHDLRFKEGEAHVAKTTEIVINSTNILTETVQNNNKWTVIEGDVINTGMWQSGIPTNFYYKDKIKVTSSKPATITGKASLWNNSSNNAKMRIGFSSTTDNDKDSFVVYQELNQNFSDGNYNLPASTYTQHEQNFSVTITEPGEYYIKGVYYMTYVASSAYSRVYSLKLTQ